jgi:hypothetical protein
MRYCPEVGAFVTVILKEPPNTSTLIPRPLGSVILTCFTLAAGFAGCIDNPDPQSVITRTSYLNEAPKAIQDLAKAIDGKNRGQIQGIILDKYGPSRHTGSGVDIEVWDVAGGNLMLHPLVGPSFTPTGGKRIWLLTTTNRALPNILGSFEMSSLPDPKGMQNWLGEVRLRSDRTYRFKDSQGVRTH